MSRPRWKSVVIAALVGLAVTAVAADNTREIRKDSQQRTVENPRLAPRPSDDHRGSAPSIAGAVSSSLSAMLVPSASSSSPGIVICEGTFFDYQHNDDGQKQLATMGDGYSVHFAWMEWDCCYCSVEVCDRAVNYRSYNSSTGLDYGLCGLVISGDGGDPFYARGGYASIDVGSAGRAHPSFHQRNAENQPWSSGQTYSSYVLDQDSNDLSLFFDNELPGSVDGEAIWPHLAIDRGGSSTKTPGDDVYHVCSTPLWDVSGYDDEIFYWRRVGPEGTWEGPVILDYQTTSLNHHVATDPTSENVAVVYNVEDIGTELLQVAYLESNINGADWISQGVPVYPSPVEPLVGGRTLVTNYSDPSGAQAWLECTGEYDSDGRFHVVWVEQACANVGPECRLQHWDNVSGTIRTITEALDFVNGGGDGGRDIWLASPQIGFGDGSTLCTDGPSNPGSGGGTSNMDYIYLTYEQYGGRTAIEGNDRSSSETVGGSQQNLEIYITASNDHGATWSPPLNLTNTKTPGCDGTPGKECASERDPSIALLVNDTIHLFYVLDVEAGDAVFGQSGWTYNPAMYYRLPGGTDADPICPALTPAFFAYLSDAETDCEYNATLDPPGTVVEDLIIRNLGNAALTGNVSISPVGATWLQLATGAYTVGPGDPDDVRTVAMSAADGSITGEGLYQAQIEITHNDTTQVSPRVMPVDFFVFDEFYCPEFITLHTDSLWLEVGNTGRYANLNEQPGGLSRLAGDSSFSIYDGSFVIAVPPSPDTIVYRNIHGIGNGQPGFRALGNLIVDTSAYGTNTGSAHAYAAMTTVDSTIGINVTYTFPQHTDSSEFVLINYHLTNRTASPLTGLVAGSAIDFEITVPPGMDALQPNSQNTGHFQPDYNLIYQQGVDTVGHAIVGDETATRFKAGVTSIQCDPAPRAWIAPNDPWLYSREGGGFHEGYLYQKMTQIGFELFPPNDPDPEEDLHAVIVFAQNVSLGLGAETGFTVGLVSSTIGNNDPADLIATTKKAWRYAFGWQEIVTTDTVPENTPISFSYYASGSHEGGLTGGCCGCVVTKVSGAAELTVGGGDCEGTIEFAGGDKCHAPYEAIFRVEDLCGDYADDWVVSIDVDGVCTCECPHQGDCDWPADPFVTALDLGVLIDHLFAGGDCFKDLQCPTSRCDFDCDCFSTALDLAEMVDYLFAGGEGPCDPCTAGPGGGPITCGEARDR